MTEIRKTVFDSSAAPDRFVFLDRDGVINVERGDFTTTVDEWEWAPGALEGLRILTEAGFGVIVITNQSCIARGIQTEEGLAALHGWMVGTAADRGGRIVAVYHCPHKQADNCSCRKPKPGLLLQAAADYGIDPASTFFVGDAARDMEAGMAAGVRTLFIEGTKASEEAGQGQPPENVMHRARDLAEAAEIVIGESKKGP